MEWSHDEPLVVPVGHLAGVFANGDNVRREIRVGRGLCDLGADEFAVWVAAHSRADPSPAGAWTRPVVEREAVALGGVAPGKIVDDLADRGLVCLLTDAASIRWFAATHRLRPLMLGLGNTPQTPRRFRVGFPEAPLLEISEPLYELWGACAAFDTLWDACAQVAPAGPVGPNQAAEDLLLIALHGLHALLAVQAAHVDVAPAERFDSNDVPGTANEGTGNRSTVPDGLVTSGWGMW